MIEIVSLERCVACDLCVQVCPTNVFDAVANAAPKIARQADCQTCFMCELYCPVDALYVAPDVQQTLGVSEQAVADQGLLGSYRASIGWSRGKRNRRGSDQTFKLIASPH
jgi:NAD-dependent dihydropyrimidine dehydrogenase PreA subunit